MAASVTINVRARSRGLWRIRVAGALLRVARCRPVARLCNRLVAPGVRIETAVGTGEWRHTRTVHVDRIEV